MQVMECVSNFISVLMSHLLLSCNRVCTDASLQPWELGKKYDGNFIFTFAVVKVRYGSITKAKIFKHCNYLK